MTNNYIYIDRRQKFFVNMMELFHIFYNLSPLILLVPLKYLSHHYNTLQKLPLCSIVKVLKRDKIHQINVILEIEKIRKKGVK